MKKWWYRCERLWRIWIILLSRYICCMCIEIVGRHSWCVRTEEEYIQQDVAQMVERQAGGLEVVSSSLAILKNVHICKHEKHEVICVFLLVKLVTCWCYIYISSFNASLRNLSSTLVKSTKSMTRGSWMSLCLILRYVEKENFWSQTIPKSRSECLCSSFLALLPKRTTWYGQDISCCMMFVI